MENMEDEKEEHTCDRCKVTSRRVRWCANPYTNDVENKIDMQWICDSCYTQLCDDI